MKKKDSFRVSHSCTPEFNPRQSLTLVHIDLSPGSVREETQRGEDRAKTHSLYQNAGSVWCCHRTERSRQCGCDFGAIQDRDWKRPETSNVIKSTQLITDHNREEDRGFSHCRGKSCPLLNGFCGLVLFCFWDTSLANCLVFWWASRFDL